MFTDVLIVCHANICRSPADEMLFKAHYKKFAGQKEAKTKFHSAGIHAVEGYEMDPVMRRLLADQGVSTGEHYARRLNQQILRDAELVLVTERRQVNAVESLDSTSRGKVYALGKWENSDVFDPHGGEETAYRASLVLIERLVMEWLKKIC